MLVKLRPALLVGGLVGAGVVGTTSGELLKKNSNPVQKENKCIIKKWEHLNTENVINGLLQQFVV